MITDREILDAARASGLHQRLAVVEYSTIPAQQREAEIIKAELARRAVPFCPHCGAYHDRHAPEYPSHGLA